MKTSPTLRMTLLAVALALLPGFVCRKLDARPVVGSIDFGGVVTYDTTSLATATKVDIWNSSFVLQDSGDFSTINPGTNAAMAAPWIFNPSTTTPALWNVGGFTFDLASSTVTLQNSQFLNITGVGTITGNGFDPTPGSWSFTSSTANGQDQATFGFQTDSSAVPEPGSAILLGIGLPGVLFAARLLRNRRKS